MTEKPKPMSLTRNPAALPGLTAGGQVLPSSSESPPLGKGRLEKFSSTRCALKGCIFPAHPDSPGRCLYHQREREEPKMFETRQPTQLVLGQAKFGLPEREPDEWRFRVRRQRARQQQLARTDEAS
jgi:hypothetical protein